MVELVDVAWGREVHLGLDLNERPMKRNDVDDQPTLVVKLPQACFIINFRNGAFFGVLAANVMNMQSSMESYVELDVNFQF